MQNFGGKKTYWGKILPEIQEAVKFSRGISNERVARKLKTRRTSEVDAEKYTANRSNTSRAVVAAGLQEKKQIWNCQQLTTHERLWQAPSP